MFVLHDAQILFSFSQNSNKSKQIEEELKQKIHELEDHYKRKVNEVQRKTDVSWNATTVSLYLAIESSQISTLMFTSASLSSLVLRNKAICATSNA